MSIILLSCEVPMESLEDLAQRASAKHPRYSAGAMLEAARRMATASEMYGGNPRTPADFLRAVISADDLDGQDNPELMAMSMFLPDAQNKEFGGNWIVNPQEN